jgi:hypothetical protein
MSFRKINHLFRNKIFIVIFFFLLTILCYSNILNNELFFDDEELIYKNVYVANLKFLPKYFTQNMVAGAGKNSNMYRPVLLTSFAIDHLFWGNNPTGYHLTSLLLHFSNTILLFLIISNLTNTKVAFLTAFLFNIHPVQTEAIAYASGRTDPLSVLFMLISILLFIKIKSLFTRKKIMVLLFSSMSFVLALLSKESSIILPFILFLLPLLKKEVLINKKNVLYLLPFIIITIIYFFLRIKIFNFDNIFNFYNNTIYQNSIYSKNIFVRIYTFSKVYFMYLYLIFFPIELKFVRNSQIITSFSNPWVIFFAVFVLFLFLISFIYKNKYPIYLFSLIFFFITILPTSGIIPINNIITEHYLYFPSIAFFLTISSILNFIIDKYKNYQIKMTVFTVISIISLLFIIRVIIRNNDWQDAIKFYTKSLIQEPSHIPIRHNLAMVYSEKGYINEAINEYLFLIKNADYYPHTRHNLANLYKGLKEYSKAEEEYKQALRIDPNFIFSYQGLYDLYTIIGETKKAEDVIEMMKKVAPPR